mmetsp:Transcript_63941/g.197967  ORF Transcript_63941/g.197967 Transcript_63941/m.197967 type:complete len:203 (+) Transcript_63941:165-773(+)
MPRRRAGTWRRAYRRRPTSRSRTPSCSRTPCRRAQQTSSTARRSTTASRRGWAWPCRSRACRPGRWSTAAPSAAPSAVPSATSSVSTPTTTAPTTCSRRSTGGWTATPACPPSTTAWGRPRARAPTSARTARCGSSRTTSALSIPLGLPSSAPTRPAPPSRTCRTFARPGLTAAHRCSSTSPRWATTAPSSGSRSTWTRRGR